MIFRLCVVCTYACVDVAILDTNGLDFKGDFISLELL